MGTELMISLNKVKTTEVAQLPVTAGGVASSVAKVFLLSGIVGARPTERLV
jgi:hypothetical protein